MKVILIAGTASGVGKTTVATGLMGALSRRGYKVQPFKAGPDYIDPSYHSQVTGNTSRNLDTWLLSRDAVLELFTRSMMGKDIALIEGVMGLYDGFSAVNDEGSTAELAKLLKAPVLLVVDSRKAARSVAALVGGYRNFDRELNLCGIILNGAANDGHFGLCRDAIEHYTGIPVLGYMPQRADLSLPERHLGLIPTSEHPASIPFINGLISQCEATLDITAIIKLSGQAPGIESQSRLFPRENMPAITRIAVAKDEAFSFYYQDNLDLLTAWGTELVFFSPISDPQLPEKAAGLYIGGGFPELYAAALAANNAMKTSIGKAAASGMPIYAECGGLMYLGEKILDLEGKEHLMVGVFPVASRIDKPSLHLGYRTIQAISDGPLLRRGDTVRGHEFHWSVPVGDTCKPNAYKMLGADGMEGYHVGNAVGSYIHLHMASRPGMAQRFIENCLEFTKSCVQ